MSIDETSDGRGDSRETPKSRQHRRAWKRFRQLPTLVERPREWANRNVGLARVTAVATFVMVIGGLVAAALTLRANRDESRRRAAAAASLRIASDSIERMILSASDGCHARGGLAHAEAVAAEASKFSDTLLEHADDPDLRLRAAHAQSQAADGWARIGQHERALQAYRRSIELTRPLIAAFPEEPQYVAARAIAYQGAGESQWRLCRVYDALEPFEQAAADYQLLVDRFPLEPSYRHGLAGALNNLGLYCWISNRRNDADKYFQGADELTRRLPEAQDSSPAGLTRHARLLSNQALLARSRGDVQQAEQLLKEAVASQQQGSRRQWHDNPAPSDALYQYYWDLAETSLGADRQVAAAQSIEMLVMAAPDRLQTYVEGATQLVNCAALAEQAVWRGGGTDPGEYYRRAHELVEQAQQAPDRRPAAVRRFAWFLLNCEVDSFRDPTLGLELAIEFVEQRPEVGGAWLTLALAHYRNGDWSAADEAVERSIERSRDAQAKARNWTLLSMIRSQQGRVDDARKLQREASDWITENNPKDKDLLALAVEAESLIESKVATATSQHSIISRSPN